MTPNLLKMLPFNISLLILNAENIRGMRPIKVLDIFDGGSKNFHPDGLFSTETFGKPGTEQRNRMFSYIPLQVPVMHPTIYKSLTDLKELYGQIMEGKAYAVFDDKLKDFFPSNIVDGRTGYNFFMEHFHELKFEERPSTSREYAIKLVYKERDDCMFKNMLVMPAGLRDFTFDGNGKPSEDEINNMYRKIFALASVIVIPAGSTNLEHLDTTRFALQKAINEVYQYIINIIEGKGKALQGWWINRKIYQSTRNVITSNVQTVDYLGNMTTVGSNDTVVGIYQFVRAIFPLAVNLIREKASNVFTGPNTPSILVNKKTLQKEMVQVTPDHYDDWMTHEGIESQLARFEIESLRHEPIMVGDHYFGLLFNDGTRVRIIQGIDELPNPEEMKKHVRPLSMVDLFYLAVVVRSRELHGLVTRYPVINYGGIYPSKIYLKTTVKSQNLIMVDENFEPTGVWANEFPIPGESFVSSMSPSIDHLVRLGADLQPL